MARTRSNMASRAGTSADPAMVVAVAIFAHQEERRIAGCLGSLPLDRPDTIFHVLVNGTTDRTVARARAAAAGRPHVIVHDIAAGGKSRTWNHFVHHLLTGTEDTIIFLDGDAQIAPGSIDALVADLAAHPQANAAAGMPVNGREVETYRRNLRIERGIFGDLYALSGRFVAAIRARYPELIISIDTWRGAVARQACGAGADLINDTWSGADPELVEVAADLGAGIVCSHTGRAVPRTRPHRVRYRDVVADVLLFHMVGFSRVSERLDFKPTMATNGTLQLSEIKIK